MSASKTRSRRGKVIPRHLVVRRHGKKFRIGVDVQVVKGLADLQVSFVQPGDHGAIRRNGVPVGALGAVAAGPSGLFAITAGHVAGLIGPGATADCLDDEAGAFPIGSVRRNRFNQGIDIAAIGPITSLPSAAVLSSTFPRDPTSADTHHRVRLMLPGLPTPIDAHINDVNMQRGFNTPIGPIVMRGLTGIGKVTVPGHSGAPALDDRGVLIGFVIGADETHTFLLPARRAVDAIQDAL
jgi:hypothetical protein